MHFTVLEVTDITSWKDPPVVFVNKYAALLMELWCIKASISRQMLKVSFGIDVRTVTFCLLGNTRIPYSIIAELKTTSVLPTAESLIGIRCYEMPREIKYHES
jgi:hypothetical protein